MRRKVIQNKTDKKRYVAICIFAAEWKVRSRETPVNDFGLQTPKVGLFDIITCLQASKRSDWLISAIHFRVGCTLTSSIPYCLTQPWFKMNATKKNYDSEPMFRHSCLVSFSAVVTRLLLYNH